ncbi:hypothetical protein K437DRAFT_274218 [Tilletiaria anomala UBC 951]|uniref:RRM domain-containing protein n=1 Tax=Tilletiaria anomala (strain ATCC 24038 / CBS 436.72 / UBC 951) TaxID=1037660 RepID=A0A066W2Z9_TILAU|nr:uncharacterized protein K437DRAFT_274218 [Tilletiaria anomala UBC 951]KDN45454.1 hypothetical protein K437DRAFT_274218 [Tilletiaria anomala UBC 951]
MQSLDAVTESFLSGIANEMPISSSSHSNAHAPVSASAYPYPPPSPSNGHSHDHHRRSSGRYDDRERSARHDDRYDDEGGRSRKRDDDDSESDRRKRRHYDDRDDRGDHYRLPSRREDRDYDRSDRRSSRRYDDPPHDREKDRYSSDRHRDREPSNRYSGRGYEDDRDRRGGYTGSYHRGSGGYPPDDYPSSYPSPHPRGGGSRDDRDRPRSGGGRGDWRNEAREQSPLVKRSPTPEGTVPISQRPRRDTKWDRKPQGFENISAQEAKVSGIFGVPGQARSLDGAPPVGMHSAGASGGRTALPPIHLGQGGGVPGAAGAGVGGISQMNRQARRLYVGNVGWDATEPLVTGFFNAKMRELNLVNRNLAGDEPCISAQINPEKGYAFVEFRSPEEATNAMAFDGIVFQQQGLKIRRPKDYVGPDVAAPTNVHVPGVVSTNVPDSPNKIFIGGLPTYLNDEQVMELLKAFGELRAFNLVREQGNGPSKGFAFCEYVDPSITDLACQGLNDMELGDRRLVVQRASLGSGKGNAGGTPVAAPPRGIAAAAAALGGSFVGGVGGAAAEEAGEPTRCMQMLNMVTQDELTDDQEYSEIVEDIRDECARYGDVLDVRIPRPEKESKGRAAQMYRKAVNSGEQPAPSADAAEGGDTGKGSAPDNNNSSSSKEREGVGRVYVKFSEKEQCAAALKAIAGRQFGGRVVIAAYLAEEQWPGDEDGGENAEETNKMATGPKVQGEEHAAGKDADEGAVDVPAQSQWQDEGEGEGKRQPEADVDVQDAE